MNDQPTESLPSIEELREQLAEANAHFPDRLSPINEEFWPAQEIGKLMGMWRSKTHVVRQLRAGTQLLLEIQRAELTEDCVFVHDEIQWSEIMQCLAELGLSETWAVEVFPPHAHVLHEIASRQIWLIDGQPDFGWRVTKPQATTANGHSFKVVGEQVDAPPAVIDALLGRARLMN